MILIKSSRVLHLLVSSDLQMFYPACNLSLMYQYLSDDNRNMFQSRPGLKLFVLSAVKPLSCMWYVQICVIFWGSGFTLVWMQVFVFWGFKWISLYYRNTGLSFCHQSSLDRAVMFCGVSAVILWFSYISFFIILSGTRNSALISSIKILMRVHNNVL